MKRLSCVLAWFLFALAVADAAPARPLYEPPDPPKPPQPVFVQFEGTAWLGKYNAVARIFIFESDGTLSYKTTATKAAPIKNKGSWRVVGETIYFEHFLVPNRKIMEFKGTIKDGNTIVGEATYPVLGTKAIQTMQRATINAK